MEVDVKDKLIRVIELLDDNIYYLAYGSNLNKKQMKHRCKDSICIGSSILENYKLKFNLYLTIEKEEKSIVPIGVYKISKEDEKALDRYEGYPTLYSKQYITIKINGRKEKALIYLMNPQFDYKIPSQGYINICKKGDNAFNFDTTILDKALEYTAQRITNSYQKIKTNE